MAIEEEFVLLAVANTYLSYDYEYSLQISETDFSFFADSSLFGGNIARFKALTLLKIFESSLEDEVATQSSREKDREIFEFLTTAIASVAKAQKIY